MSEQKKRWGRVLKYRGTQFLKNIGYTSEFEAAEGRHEQGPHSGATDISCTIKNFRQCDLATKIFAPGSVVLTFSILQNTTP